MENNKLNRTLSVVFALALMAGCASTDTQDDSDVDSDRPSAEEQRDAEARAREEAERARQRAEQEAREELEYVFYFDFDTAALQSGVRAELDKHIALLKDNNKNVRVEGHADERGTREYNMALGERRANSVANYLIVNGIPRYRIETVSYGEERPVAHSHDEEAWEKNRRVELKIN